MKTELKFPYVIAELLVLMKLLEKKKLNKVYSYQLKIGKDVST